MTCRDQSDIDIHSWWEVPCVAHFCSLFRASFNLIDFDIEDLEEALLTTDDSSDGGNTLIPELMVRLLRGYYANSNISSFNHQIFLRRLFKQKCREYACYNPFDNDMDFQFLPLRTKVEILHMLCDFRLDADDVMDLLKDLDADSLRVNPLGYDANKSAYWYFYGTRLYKEDYPQRRKKAEKREKEKRRGRKRKRGRNKEEDGTGGASDDEMEMGAGIWNVICFTESDWERLALKTKESSDRDERALHRVLNDDFLPEIPKLFAEKERLQRKRFSEFHPRKSSRIEKQKQRKEEEKKIQDTLLMYEVEETEEDKHKLKKERHERWANRNNLKEVINENEISSEDGVPVSSAYGAGIPARKNNQTNNEIPSTSKGRQTNNSLASAPGGKICIDSADNVKQQTDNWYNGSTLEDLQVGMYKVMNKILAHEDAWPFIEPVDEELGPDNEDAIDRPMSLHRMEEKLDRGKYDNLEDFKTDFHIIVTNCRQYNGTRNDCTAMGANLARVFNIEINKYIDNAFSSDESDEVSSDDFSDGPTCGYKNKKKRAPTKKSTTQKAREDADKYDRDNWSKFNGNLRENVMRADNAEDKAQKKISEDDGSNLEELNVITAQTLKDINELLDDAPRYNNDEYGEESASAISSLPTTITTTSPTTITTSSTVNTTGNIVDSSSNSSNNNNNNSNESINYSASRIAAEHEIYRNRTNYNVADNKIKSTTNLSVSHQLLLIKNPRKSQKSQKKDVAFQKKKIKESCKQLLLQRRSYPRPIARLQPGKSKGNLYSNNNNNNVKLNLYKESDAKSVNGINGLNSSILYPKIVNINNRPRPMLSLGSVLSNVDCKSSIFGVSGSANNNINSNNNNNNSSAANVSSNNDDINGCTEIVDKNLKDDKIITSIIGGNVEKSTTLSLTDTDKEQISEPPILDPASQQGDSGTSGDVNVSKTDNNNSTTGNCVTKPAPNLSAWLKAFGTPQTTSASFSQKWKSEQSSVTTTTSIMTTSNSSLQLAQPGWPAANSLLSHSSTISTGLSNANSSGSISNRKNVSVVGVDKNSTSSEEKRESSKTNNKNSSSNKSCLLDDDKYDEAPPPTPGRFFLYEEDKDRLTGTGPLSPESNRLLLSSGSLPARRNSTGSSISENSSSFSQDPNDPMSSPHPSLDEPYLSPRPLLHLSPFHHQSHHHGNSSLNIGFYQDTAFSRLDSDVAAPNSSPECGNSPRGNNNNNNDYSSTIGGSSNSSPRRSPPPPIYHPSITAAKMMLNNVSSLNFYKNNRSPSPTPPPPSPPIFTMSNNDHYGLRPGYMITVPTTIGGYDSNVYTTSNNTTSNNTTTTSSLSRSSSPTPFSSMFPMKKRLINDFGKQNDEFNATKDDSLSSRSSPCTIANDTIVSINGTNNNNNNSENDMKFGKYVANDAAIISHRHHSFNYANDVLGPSPYYRPTTTTNFNLYATDVDLKLNRNNDVFSNGARSSNNNSPIDYLNKAPSTPCVRIPSAAALVYDNDEQEEDTMQDGPLDFTNNKFENIKRHNNNNNINHNYDRSQNNAYDMIMTMKYDSNNEDKSDFSNSPADGYRNNNNNNNNNNYTTENGPINYSNKRKSTIRSSTSSPITAEDLSLDGNKRNKKKKSSYRYPKTTDSRTSFNNNSDSGLVTPIPTVAGGNSYLAPFITTESRSPYSSHHHHHHHSNMMTSSSANRLITSPNPLYNFATSYDRLHHRASPPTNNRVQSSIVEKSTSSLSITPINARTLARHPNVINGFTNNCSSPVNFNRNQTNCVSDTTTDLHLMKLPSSITITPSSAASISSSDGNTSTKRKNSVVKTSSKKKKQHPVNNVSNTSATTTATTIVPVDNTVDNQRINTNPSSLFQEQQRYLNRSKEEMELVEKVNGNLSAFNLTTDVKTDYQQYLENLRKSTNYFVGAGDSATTIMTTTPVDDKRISNNNNNNNTFIGNRRNSKSNGICSPTALHHPPTMHFPYLAAAHQTTVNSTSGQTLAQALINPTVSPCPSFYSNAFLQRATTAEDLLRPMIIPPSLLPAHHTATGFPPHGFFNVHHNPITRSPW